MADYIWGTGTTTSSCTISNDGVWYGWNATASTCNTLTINATWASWSGNIAYEAPQETAEQQAAREERQRIAAEASAKRRQESEAAKERAEALLRSFLTPEQEASYFGKGYFELIVEGGARPPRHYRIERGSHGNIKRLENGQVVERWCVQPSQMPTADINLCQMLELAHREEEYRKVANVTRAAA